MTRTPGLVLLALLSLAACKRQDMYTQDRAQSWDRSNFFPKGLTMRTPVAGTVSRDDADQPVAQPAMATMAMLVRGHQRYDIFCAPCHGATAAGDGMIVQRGFPRPPSFHSAALRTATAVRYYDAITHGHGVMYSYAARVPPADRWAIIAYIRALQRSQDAPAAALSALDRAQLAGGP